MGILSAQNEKCGTMQNLDEMLLKDPTLKFRMDSIEEQTQHWLRNSPNSRVKNYNYQNISFDKVPKKDNNGHSIMSLCGNNNTYFTSITAPTVLNQVVSPSPNCTFGGEYVRVYGMVAGNIYRITTCGVNNFDTQLSIYNTSGFAVAHNDDACGSQSEILFNPIVTETFDVLIDQYDCTSNSLCASLQVELIYTPRSVITIPVVVHVVHFGEPIGTGRNISDAQIQSQINVLNKDFRRYNADIFNVPAAFRGVSDDPLIQFCLAQQDESGNSTNGIKRWVSSNPQVTVNDMNNSIKPATIWDRNKYLNLWTVDFAVSLLGFAQFPGDPYPGNTAATDGVVIQYTAFGNTGNVVAPYNLGRTASHEVGHWLNLRHIWGDEPACSGDDFVFDTPNQADKSSGSPSFPVTDACTGVYPGINFYNYMDYSNDAIISMFTFGQAGRMDAALFGPRSSLLTSIGCQTPTGINESTTDFNVKIYPNPSNGIVNISFLETASNVIIEIYDLLGKQVHYQIISNISLGTVQTINLNEFVGGIYNVRITSDKNIINHKLLLTK